MRPTHRIESFLGSKSRVAVLRILASTDLPLNASQIARQARLTRPAATTVLDDLASMGFVRSSSAGRANVHLLNRLNVYVERIILPLFEAEAVMPEMLEADLRASFGDQAESIVLFGSYARGDQHTNSDIDVVLIAGPNSDKQALDRTVDLVAREFRSRYGVPLSAMTYASTEAEELGSTAPALLESLREDGLVIKGKGPWEWSADE